MWPEDPPPSSKKNKNKKLGKIIQHGRLSRDSSAIALLGEEAIKQVQRGNKEEHTWSQRAYQRGVRTQRQEINQSINFTSDEVHQSLRGSKHQHQENIHGYFSLKVHFGATDARVFKKKKNKKNKFEYFIIVINSLNLGQSGLEDTIPRFSEQLFCSRCCKNGNWMGK